MKSAWIWITTTAAVALAISVVAVSRRKHKTPTITDTDNASSLPNCTRIYPSSTPISKQQMMDAIQQQTQFLFVHDTSTSKKNKWQDMSIGDVKHELEKSNMGMRLMVTPTGVVGWYDSKKVKTTVDPHSKQIWGQDPSYGKFPLRHLQHDYDRNNFNFYIQSDMNPNKTKYYITPEERYYFRTLESPAGLSLLRDLIPEAIPLEKEFLDNVNLYVSGKGIITNLHVDGRSGIIVQVKGRKRVYVFPKSEMKYAAMYPPGHPLERRSQIDTALTSKVIQNTDLKNALGYEFILEPGMWLYIPALWLHYEKH